MINLYDSKCTDFTNNGLVVLSDAVSCMVNEELNGMYELTMEYPFDYRSKWKYLVEGNVIKADGQLFRIYRKVKTLTSIQINARHIFYDLLDNVCMDIRLVYDDGATALKNTLAGTQYSHPFSNASDVSGEQTIAYARRNPVDIIMNATDGIIKTWGGELIRDNFAIGLMVNRGLDRGVLISYGKNIQGIEETLDVSGICTRLIPVGTASAVTTDVDGRPLPTADVGPDGLLLPEIFLDSQYVNNYPYPKTRVQQFDSIQVEVPVNLFVTSYPNGDSFITEGYDITYDTGVVKVMEKYFVTDPIPVVPNAHYFKNSPDTVTFHDESKIFISGLPGGLDFTTPPTCCYVRIVGMTQDLYSMTLFRDAEDFKTIALDQLRIVGQKYLDSGIDIPQYNYQIDFTELSKTEEYKNYSTLESVYLGDTVTIRHSRLGIDLKSKAIKITKNCLTDKIEKIELGNFKSNVANSINATIQDVKTGTTNQAAQISKVTNTYQNAINDMNVLINKAIDNATSLITSPNVTSGHVIMHAGDDGKVYEILIMDTDDMTTAVKVWRWNLGGLGYSSTGVNGPYETAMTMNGQIIAKFLFGLELTAEQINAVDLQTLRISGTLNTGNTLEIGPPNADGGQCHINTALEAMRFQAHIPGNYFAYTDDGGVTFYVGDKPIGTIFPNGTTSIKAPPPNTTTIAYNLTGFIATQDNVDETWTWTKDGNGLITKLTGSSGRVINVTR